MQPKPRLATAKPQLKARPYPVYAIVAKSCLATIAILSAGLGLMFFAGIVDLASLNSHGDSLSGQQIHDRLIAFRALPPVKLQAVSDIDLPAAIKSMELPAAAAEALSSDLHREDETALLGAATPSTSSSPILSSDKRDALPAPQPKPQAENSPDRVRLAWVSVWDTDYEDGDTVQIDSDGYSRTIVLKKQPVTLAIPVPLDGLIQVTGIRDGDGGGITVGLSSGASVAVFPIMSEGQVLGLKVSR